jgi:16S rRNA (cytidine1402-2'-O)-methyltransferase
MLYIIATPIGNLEDITLRAIRTLKEADLILAEDTRTTGKLLKKYEIKTPMKSFHHHSSTDKIDWVVGELKNECNIALVTDAGTPGIADPAGHLVEAVQKAGLKVTPIPGSSSITALLSVAGINTDRFIFVGFLPKKKGRQTLFKSLENFDMPIVIFESPMRVSKTLKDIENYLGNREVIIGRELTKLYEEILRMKISEAIAHFATKKPKGEFVIIVH